MLTKFCKPKYNPKKVAGDSFKLRVGTLYDFRKHENPELADGQEGIFEYRLCLPPGTIVDADWINSIQTNVQIGEPTPPIKIYGRMKSTIGRGESVIDSEGKLAFRLDEGGYLNYEHPNAFVFCMSKDLKKSPFKSQQDKWSFPVERAKEFSDLLANSLLAQLYPSQVKRMDAKDRRAVPYNVLNNANTQPMAFGHECGPIPDGLVVRYGEVDYDKSRHLIRTQKDLTRDGLIDKLQRSPISKPSSFHRECEFRFIFLVCSKDTVLEPNIKHIDLEVPWLQWFLS